MLRVDPQSKILAPLGRRTLQPVSVLQRYALADLIAGSPVDFFEDLGLEMTLLSPGLELPSGRAALLAADRDGAVYVVATERKGDRLDLIDPLEDASQLTRWSGPELLGRLATERAYAARAFLRAPVASLNQEQGVMLVGESFDLETLGAAGWLRRRYNVQILCFRARMAVDPVTGREYLSCRDLTEEIERVYLQQKRDEEDSAPWPTISPDSPSTTPIPEAVEPVSAADALRADVDEVLVGRRPEAVYDAPADPGIDSELDPASGDPLDDVLAAQSLVPLAEQQPAEQRQWRSERRVADRREDLQARRLRLDYFGKLLGARLVDFSRKGIGVEALSALPIGAEIGISGELIGKDGSLGLDGRVKVRHCTTG